MRKTIWIPLFCTACFPVFGGEVFFDDIGASTNTEIFRNVHGAGFFDYNGDGWDDIFVCSNLSEAYENQYFLNGHLSDILLKNDQGFRFLDATTEAGVWGYFEANVSDQGMAAADYDNDGYMDFCAANAFGVSALLWHQDPNQPGHFTNYTESAGLLYGGTYGRKTRNVTFMDYNNDGYVDIFFGRDNALLMLRNTGNGTFIEDTHSGLEEFYGTGDYIHGFAIGDVNNDGYLDIFQTSFIIASAPEIGTLSALFINAGASNPGHFIRAMDCGINMGVEYVGAVFFDYNNDGWLDLLVNENSIYQGPRLYQNLGDGTFANVRNSVGLTSHCYSTYFGCGFTIADFDNDGYEDIFSASDDGINNRLFRNQGNGTNVFVDESFESGVVFNRAACWPSPVADYNHDGFVDIFLNKTHYQDPAVETTLLRNNGHSRNHWFQVRLKGQKDIIQNGSNWTGIGARVTIWSGGMRQTRLVIGGQGYQCNSFPAKFGLGGSHRVDSLIINWPGGIRQKLTNIPADTLLDVVEADDSGQFERYSIAGVVKFAQDTLVMVPNVHVVRTGSAQDSAYTSSSGVYTMSEIPAHSNVIITPWKAVTDTGINAQDAALAARKAVGLETLTDMQIARADVDANGRVDAFDAALIARAAVQLPAIAGSLAGSWRFSPASVTYPDYVDNLTEVNFQADLIGDVDGSWSSSGLGKTASWTPFPDSVTPDSLGEFTIPVNIEDGQQCLSADFRLAFDQSGLEFLDATPAEHPSPSNLVIHTEPGIVRLALWRTTYLEGPTNLLELRFRKQSAFPTVLTWEKTFLNGQPVVQNETVIQTGTDETSTASPSDFNLTANFPNPFNGGTTIRYQLGESELVELAVFNVSGRKIVSLVQGWQEQGEHQVFWNGKDQSDLECPSGIYVYRLSIQSKCFFEKMIKLK